MAWYYKDYGSEIGPISKTELQALINKRVVTGRTLVRSPTSSDWAPLSEIVKAQTKKAEAKKQLTESAAEPVDNTVDDPVEDSPVDPIMDTAGDTGDKLEEDVPPEQPLTVCSQCGRSFPHDQVLDFEGQAVCGACKPLFVQRLKEGVGVLTQYHYAGFWIRLAAKIIDWILISIAQWGLLIPLSLMGSFSMPTSPSDMSSSGFYMLLGGQQLLGIIIPALYNTFFIGRFSATPGKMACRLKVVMPEGAPVSYPRALGRNFAEFISALILLIGYIMAGFDTEKRALHDRICSTRVIYKND